MAGETVVTETEVPAGDLRNDILQLLAGEDPWLFITADPSGDDDKISVKLEAGGGVRNVAMIRHILKLTMNALPEEG